MAARESDGEGRGSSDGDAEVTVGRFTEWFARTPNALEFREVLLTDERLLAPVVGESFRAALLRADTGEAGRRALDDRSPAEIAASGDCDVAVSLSALRSIRLRRGSPFRRATLTLRWSADAGATGELTLHNTSEGDEQAEAVEALAADDRLSHVDCAVEAPRFGLF